MKKGACLKEIKKIIVSYWPLLLVIPVIYSLKKGFDKNYWDAVMSGLLATFLSVVIGIPIALWINRQTQASEEAEREKEAKRKNVEILKHIKQELVFDKDRLKDRQSSPKALQRHPYQVDVWEAFSASGEIKWISNINLLNRIASAYSIIKNEKFIEQNCYLAAKGAYAFAGTEGAVQSMLKDARDFDEVLENNIDFALKEIDAELRKFHKS